MMDAGDLKSASSYINNQLASRGLLRGLPIDFSRPSHDPENPARIINLVHELIQRRDREAEQRENLAITIRSLRATEGKQVATIESQKSKITELERKNSLLDARTRILNTSLCTTESSLKTLRDENIRQKTLLAQVRTRCANDIRKRDMQIQKMKERLVDTQRGSRARGASKIIITPGHRQSYDSADTAESLGSKSLSDDTVEFLTNLSQNLADENDSIVALVRKCLSTLKAVQGLPDDDYVLQNEEEVGNAANLVIAPPANFDVLNDELGVVMASLQDMLNQPNYVPIEDLAERDAEIKLLTKKNETLRAEWKKAIDLVDGWNDTLKAKGVEVESRQLVGIADTEHNASGEKGHEAGREREYEEALEVAVAEKKKRTRRSELRTEPEPEPISAQSSVPHENLETEPVKQGASSVAKKLNKNQSREAIVDSTRRTRSSVVRVEHEPEPQPDTQPAQEDTEGNLQDKTYMVATTSTKYAQNIGHQVETGPDTASIHSFVSHHHPVSEVVERDANTVLVSVIVDEVNNQKSKRRTRRSTLHSEFEEKPEHLPDTRLAVVDAIEGAETEEHNQQKEDVPKGNKRRRPVVSEPALERVPLQQPPQIEAQSKEVGETSENVKVTRKTRKSGTVPEPPPLTSDPPGPSTAPRNPRRGEGTEGSREVRTSTRRTRQSEVALESLSRSSPKNGRGMAAAEVAKNGMENPRPNQAANKTKRKVRATRSQTPGKRRQSEVQKIEGYTNSVKAESIRRRDLSAITRSAKKLQNVVLKPENSPSSLQHTVAERQSDFGIIQGSHQKSKLNPPLPPSQVAASKKRQRSQRNHKMEAVAVADIEEKERDQEPVLKKQRSGRRRAVGVDLGFDA